MEKNYIEGGLGEMNYNYINKTELKVSEIGFGTWPISGHGMGSADEQQSLHTLFHARDRGVNFFDTADMYGFGYAETLLGKVFKHHKDDVIIATKVGMQWDNQGNLRKNLRADYIRQACEDSLKRLQTDRIDLYQLHWPDPETPLEETMEALSRLVDQGKVRYVGVSNFSVEEMKEAGKYLPLVSNQIEYSLLERSPENEVIPYASKGQISILPYKILGRGILTGKFKGVAHFEKGDWRSEEEIFKQEQLAKSLAAVEQLRPIAESYGCSISQLVIAWALRWDMVPSVIIGARRPEQISESCADLNFSLHTEHISQINALFEQPDKQNN
ncbi:hypothetical protein GNP93_14990 [Paenibacillus validus]|uniref:NADP-dependent oxidoreductase domain-containing protein n=2 Tax=Paenibacillus TaxID=44249 RepID=A0A7X2ZCV3_9BACL|nr:hypothetical protein [Paenibacillus validus]